VPSLCVLAAQRRQRMRHKTPLALWLLVPILLSVRMSPAASPELHEQRVRDYTTAYNDRKLSAMMASVTDDVEWLSVAGSKITVESAGKGALQKGMEGYFTSMPSAKSELVWVQVTPTRVAALEKASWQTAAGPRSQVALAVYEFRDGLIARVYYYSAEK
jgi:hypothetical protein